MAPQETLFSCLHSARSAGWCSSVGLSIFDALLGVWRPSSNHSHSRTQVLVQCGVPECWRVIFHRRFRKKQNLESTWRGKVWHVGIMRIKCDDQQRWLEDCTQQAKQRGWRRAAVWWSPSQHSATIGEWDLREICFEFWVLEKEKWKITRNWSFPYKFCESAVDGTKTSWLEIKISMNFIEYKIFARVTLRRTFSSNRYKTIFQWLTLS